MSGPPVQSVSQMDSFNTLKAENDVFFVYVGLRNCSLWKTFVSVAEIFQPHSFFYSTSREIASRYFQIDTVPTVLVFKENNHFHFPREYQSSFYRADGACYDLFNSIDFSGQ